MSPSVALGSSLKKHDRKKKKLEKEGVSPFEKEEDMHNEAMRSEDEENDQEIKEGEGALEFKPPEDEKDNNEEDNNHVEEGNNEEDEEPREGSDKVMMGLVSQNISVERHRKKVRKETSRLSSSTKHKKLNREKIEKEQMQKKTLENLLFGSLYAPVEYGKEDEIDGVEQVGGFGAHFFVDKSSGNDGILPYEDNLQAHARSDVQEFREDKLPVWVDEEEERAAINISDVNMLRKLRKEVNEKVISGSEYVSRLRAQHAKLNPATEWAQTGPRSGKTYASDDDSADESEVTFAAAYEDNESENILRRNDDLVSKSGTRLLPGLLEYSRLLDANSLESSNGPINSVKFHGNAQLLLAAGLDKRLRFFQVDGKRNTLIQSIFLEDCPIRQAAFVPDGSQVIASGRRRFFYSLDLVKASVDKIGPLTGRDERSLEKFEISPDSKTIAFIGDEGYILLVSSKTKELVGTLKMNGTVQALAFADEGRVLLSSGGDGQVYHWDLRTRRCIHKATDEGCINGSALCTSPDSTLFAAGSSTGIVNVYKKEEFLGGKRKPLKTIENLTTAANAVKFNHDAQILAILSTMKRSSLKLVHVPSFTVFSNFPPPMSNLRYPRCLDFSPNSGFMAVGNAAGRVMLYKLHHYQNA